MALPAQLVEYNLTLNTLLSKKIVDNFLFQVSLDSRVREIINKNMMSPTQRTFDEAQLQIYTLMHRDSYPRFVNSPAYRNLLKSYGGSVKDLAVTAT